MKILTKTRNNIFKVIKIEGVYWAGNLSEIDFLSQIFDLRSLPSNDSRYNNMHDDVWQHRVNNPNDWEDDWILKDTRINLLNIDDDTFLHFLCEMLHPVVRPDTKIAYSLQKSFNECLKLDGYELVEKEQLASKPVFEARGTIAFPVRSSKEDISIYINEEYVNIQISTMEAAINSKPYLAIGIAKELIETICKTILTERGKIVNKDWDLPKLFKETIKELRLTPSDIPDEAKASITIKSVLGSLSTVVHGISELRNSYGSGHGKDSRFLGLKPRHAKLVVGAASTLAIFVLETYKTKQ